MITERGCTTNPSLFETYTGSSLLLQTIPVVQSITMSVTTVICNKIGINNSLRLTQEQWIQEQDASAYTSVLQKLLKEKKEKQQR